MQIDSLRALTLALALGVAIAGAETPASPSTTPDAAESRLTTVDDLRPHERKEDGYSEVWTYHIYLDNDVQLYLNFSRANLGSFKGRICGAELSIVGLAGESYTVAREYPPERAFGFDEANHRLRVHPTQWLEGKLPERHHVHFETGKDGFEYLVDLEFSDIAPGRVPGHSSYRVGDDSVSMYVHIPYARVAGTVRVSEKGRQVKEIAANGTAYMDHTVFTGSAGKLVKRGYRYIRHAKDQWQAGYLITLAESEGEQVLGYEIVGRGGVVEVRRPSAVQVVSSEKLRGVVLARTLEVKLDSDHTRTVARTADKQWLSALREVPRLVRWVAKKFAGGELLIFRGEALLDDQDAHYSYFVVK